MINIKHILTDFTINSKSQFFEDYLMVRSSLLGCVISLIGVLTNYLLDLSVELTLTTLVGFFVFLLFFFLFRRGAFKQHIYLLSIVFTIIYLNILWFFHYRSEGPILFLLIICYAYLILAYKRYKPRIIAVTAILNMLLLFFLDSNLPASRFQYPDEGTRKADIYVVAILSVILLVEIISIVMKYYERELIHAQESDRILSSDWDILAEPLLQI